MYMMWMILQADDRRLQNCDYSRKNASVRFVRMSFAEGWN
jgi:hypothetical protein